MSMEFVSRTTTRKARTSWSSVAFIVESILLLVFLMGSLAVLTQVFTASLTRSIESRTLDAATIAATSTAERFAADPTEVEESTQVGDLQVTCTVTEHPRVQGVLYEAHIDVYDNSPEGSGNVVYSITTSRYESGA